MAEKAKHLYEFGPYRLDPAQRLLFRGKEIIPLTPKAIETLLVLVEQRGQLLTKEELLSRVWPGVFVEEVTLAKNISTLRKALGDAPEGHEYIETHAKRGYRFVADVRRMEAAEAPVLRHRTAWLVAACAVLILGVAGFTAWSHYGSRSERPARVTLMVLPFENLNHDPEQEYLSDGLTEELITQLSRLDPSRLGVIARASAMQYKGKAKSVADARRELNADYVLEGSVQHEGSRVRITAQLVETRGQTHVWAENYELEMHQLLDLQRDVSLAVARQIALKLVPQSAARANLVDREAYELYLKGRYFWNKRNKEGSQKAQAFFRQALERDPNYAAAYAGLAEMFVESSGPEHDKGEELARKALSLDDTLSEAHISLAVLRMGQFDWSTAGKELRRGLELDPGNPAGHIWNSVFLLAHGQSAAAVEAAGRAKMLDPLSALANHQLGVALYYQRDFDRAAAQFRKALELEPDNLWTQIRLAQALFYGGKRAEAEAAFAQAARSNGAAELRWAHALAVSGKTAEARKIMERYARQPGATSFLDVAAISEALGESEHALQFLEQTWANRHSDLWYLPVDPRFDLLRKEPRFQSLLKRIVPES